MLRRKYRRINDGVHVLKSWRFSAVAFQQDVYKGSAVPDVRYRSSTHHSLSLKPTYWRIPISFHLFVRQLTDPSVSEVIFKPGTSFSRSDDAAWKRLKCNGNATVLLKPRLWNEFFQGIAIGREMDVLSHILHFTILLWNLMWSSMLSTHY
jgi:hypothetical protein